MSQSQRTKSARSLLLLASAIAGFSAVLTVSHFISHATGDTAAVAEKAPAAPPDARVTARTPEEAGRYLVMIGGCNDCHTPGYSMAGGQIPELEWLTGSEVGWYGPWGTTYASNLRLMVADMPEDAWVKMLHERHDRPPMPWASVNAMSEQDSRAMYTFIKHLGKRGEKMPQALPAGSEPKTPYLSLIPQSPGKK